MNKRVTFRVRTTSSDGMGGTTDTGSTDILTTWASINPIGRSFQGGREYMKQDAMKSDISHLITCRYRDDLVGKGHNSGTYDNILEAVYNGRRFNILYARDIGEDQKYVEMEAKEEL